MSIKDAIRSLMEHAGLKAADFTEPPGDGLPTLAEADLTGDIVALEEAELSEAGAKIRLIAPGWGSSGYYSADMLKRDGPGVFKSGTKMFWDHQTEAESRARPEGSLTNLAGELLEDAAWDAKGAAGPGLYAKTKLFGHYAGAVKELAPHIGVSIRAMGTQEAGEAEGRKGPIITGLKAARSVDFVTVAGAGGKVTELFEAARLAAHQEAAPIQEGEGMAITEAELKAISEAAAKAATEAVKPLLEAETAARVKAEERLAAIEKQASTLDARAIAESALSKSTLPAVTQQRLVASLAESAPRDEAGALDREAYKKLIESEAKREADYLAALRVPSGVSNSFGGVRGMGSASLFETEVKTEDVHASLAESFKKLGLSEASAKVAAAGR